MWRVSFFGIFWTFTYYWRVREPNIDSSSNELSKNQVFHNTKWTLNRSGSEETTYKIQRTHIFFYCFFITSRMTLQCFALICYRQAGEKSQHLLKSLYKNKQTGSQNPFSNTNRAVLKVWDDSCCALPSNSTVVDVSDLCQAQAWQNERLLSSWWTSKSSLTFWSAEEGWCDKPIWDKRLTPCDVHS